VDTTVSGLPTPLYWMCEHTQRDEDGVYGAAWYRTQGSPLRVIESVCTRADGRRWLHVSVSKPNRKVPTWEDVQAMRLAFVGEERECYLIFPTKDRYVNIHPGVLHLYCCLDASGGVLPHMDGLVAPGIMSV
jgi:hypothetical protein